MKFRMSLAMLVTLLLNGCAFLNVELIPQTQPLQEMVVEGEGKPKLLLLDITGIMSEKERGGGLSQEQPSMVAELKEALLKAEKDEDIAGVVLRINSPGGTVTASDIIYHELLNFRKEKKVPLYASIVGMGTSGAYYAACAADEISAHPTAVTGSIGVILMKFNVEGLMSKIGVSELTIKSGEKKDLLSPFRPTTPEEQRLVQEIIDSLHRRFVDVAIARPRNSLQRGELEKLADGRIYTSDQALQARLIDRVGYLDETIDTMKKALKLEKAKVITYYRPGSYRGSIYSGPAGAAPVINLVNFDLGGLDALGGSTFMYLWRP